MSEEIESSTQLAEGDTEITDRKPNLFEHQTIGDAFQYLMDNFEGTEFELAKEMGRTYAERVPYSEIKRYERIVHLKNELYNPEGAIEEGFMLGMLEFVEEVMESGGCLGLSDGTTEEQLDAFPYYLDLGSIMEQAGFVIPDSLLEQSNNEKKDSPSGAIRFGMRRRLIRLENNK